MIRTMTIEDIGEVQNIEKVCFNNKVERRFEIIKAFVEEKISLVYEEEGVIGGYIFNHICGSFAWFGTFGVRPDYRGKDIGKQLVKETINIFNNEFNINNIGLVTMPESSYNLGFYLNLGFKPKELALRLYKIIEDNIIENMKNNFNVEFVNMQNEIEYTKIINIAEEISKSLYKGLDMSSELRIAHDSNMGLGFIVYEKNEVVGFGILRNKMMLNDDRNYAALRLLCLKDSVSSYTEAIDAVLYKMYEYGISNNCERVFIDINTVHYDICSHLLTNHAFKIDKSSVTLIMGNENFYSSMKGIMLFKTVT